MKYLVLVAGLLVAGCGSSDGGDGGGGSPLEGSWQLNTNGCVFGYKFEGNVFADNFLCELANGGYGTELESGTFTAQGAEIDFLPKHASCPAHSWAFTAPYSVDNNKLILTIGSTIAVLGKYTPSTANGGGGAVIKTGCWDTSTTPFRFTPHAMQDL